MSQANRVFITGRSALTSIGASADATWNAVLSGTSGIGDITQWDIASFPARLGGEIKDFQPAKLLPDRKLVKVISRQDVLGINAATQAVEHSGMVTYRDTLALQDEFNEQTAVFVGSPGNKYFQQYDFLSLIAKTQGNIQEFAKHLFDEVHPTWLLRILPNNVLAYTGITYGFKGPNHNVTNHAIGGTQALLEAFYAIQSGQAERAVVVGYDIGPEPQALFYYDKLGVLSYRHLKPFDFEHDGTILAEGAAALVLESENSVRARSARCYGEILGGSSSTEAAGLFSLQADGKPLAALIENTLNKIDRTYQDLDCIIAHGNGNRASDESEARALVSLMGKDMKPVTAFKWAMGHTITASGVLDAVLTSYALESQCLPGIANLSEPASLCQDLLISSEHRALKPNGLALMINRGFASLNACLVLQSCG